MSSHLTPFLVENRNSIWGRQMRGVRIRVMSDSQLLIDALVEFYHELPSKYNRLLNVEEVDDQINTALRSFPELKLSLLELLKKETQIQEKVHRCFLKIIDGKEKEIDLSSLSLLPLEAKKEEAQGFSDPPRSQDIPLNIDFIQPYDINPSIITNRLVADRYLRKVILKNARAKLALYDLINKQKKTELRCFLERKNHEQTLRENFKKSNASSSLSVVNYALQGRASQQEQTHVDKHMMNKDYEIQQVFVKLYRDFYMILRKYRVPFFCLEKELYYKHLDSDRKFLLELMVDLLYKE